MTLARMLSQLPDRPSAPVRRMREFSPEVEVLSVCADRLAEVIQAIGVTKGAKPKAIRPLPRPVTAMQRLASRKRKAKHDSLVARMLPHRAAGAARNVPVRTAPVRNRATGTTPVKENIRE